MWFCQECQEAVVYIREPFCSRCGTPLASERGPCRQCQTHPLRALDSIRSVALFEGDALPPAIHRLKYQHHKVAAQALVNLALEHLNDNLPDVEVIVPVPLHPSRRRERGYNQSDLIARHLSRALRLPVDKRTLRRTRATAPQARLGSADRIRNVQNAFACRDNTLQDKAILLIDDVCTTGATLDACAHALKQGRARAVHSLTLARAP